MLYHEGYYSETGAYAFSMSEIDRLEAATNELFGMCCAAVQQVIDQALWDRFFIPGQYADYIRRSWQEDDVSLYGRFDLGYDSRSGAIKLLEFNADTPTGLLEGAVIQWDWREKTGHGYDQWNSLHERLVAHLQGCRAYLDTTVHFACARDSAEDRMTVEYLAECARQAGFQTRMLYMEEVSVDPQNAFCEPDGTPIRSIFKLYPWEWLFHEEFGQYLYPNYDSTTWIEPPYKAILSNKMLLPLLWELYPGHPLLLESVYVPGGPFVKPGRWVRKPVFSREGANVEIYDDGRLVESTAGEYGEEGFIAQRFFQVAQFDGWLPVLGAWVVAGEAAGMTIREQKGSLITTNMSQFVPHFIE